MELRIVKYLGAGTCIANNPTSYGTLMNEKPDLAYQLMLAARRVRRCSKCFATGC